MEIKRTINKAEITIILTEQELHEAYRERKRILDVNEVRDVLKGWTTGDILHCCHFPYPSYHYLRDERIEDAEEDLLENEVLMLDIYERFGDYQAEGNGSYGTDMENACMEVLAKFGKENPNFLKSYETIDVIAYKKYQKDWIKNQNFSKEYMEKIQKEYQECKNEYYPNDTYAFQQYIDEYGYHSMCYVCADEFRNGEYQDAEYMNSLLTDEEYSQYLMEEWRC